mmetsp:Transcript_20926/g.65519  ORF Transcript_20926/g.65519 Transcript_20926/m.65519 type:complete len:214 (+) Transcript_20926:222-863(+)
MGLEGARASSTPACSMKAATSASVTWNGKPRKIIAFWPQVFCGRPSRVFRPRWPATPPDVLLGVQPPAHSAGSSMPAAPSSSGGCFPHGDSPPAAPFAVAAASSESGRSPVLRLPFLGSWGSSLHLLASSRGSLPGCPQCARLPSSKSAVRTLATSAPLGQLRVRRSFAPQAATGLARRGRAPGAGATQNSSSSSLSRHSRKVFRTTHPRGTP